MIETPRRMTKTPFVPSSPANEPYALVAQVLDLVRLSGAVFFLSDFRSPWAYVSPPAELESILPPSRGSLVMFHFVASGSCWVAMDDGVRHELSAGDVVVMPYGDPNRWGSMEPAEAVPIGRLMPPLPWTRLPHLEYGGDGEPTRVVCGYLRGDAILFDPVLRALPSLFVVRPPAGPTLDWLIASVEYAMAAAAPHGGATSTPDTRLPEALFAEILRLYLADASTPTVSGWLAALRDPVAGPALARLHADPARDWTVRDLAMEVAVSRTVLVEAFVRHLGRPPIRYLTEWRLRLASGLVRRGATVAEAAEAVGYSSEAAFSRAFKREFGESPAHWRAKRGA
ncbi:MAG: AraC family transcriptional regulator [Chloroflexota bacterium]